MMMDLISDTAITYCSCCPVVFACSYDTDN